MSEIIHESNPHSVMNQLLLLQNQAEDRGRQGTHLFRVGIGSSILR